VSKPWISHFGLLISGEPQRVPEIPLLAAPHTRTVTTLLVLVGASYLHASSIGKPGNFGTFTDWVMRYIKEARQRDETKERRCVSDNI
jgi:formylmethanofuran dehydrogenase subunit A